jgi:hypothetical protein
VKRKEGEVRRRRREIDRPEVERERDNSGGGRERAVRSIERGGWGGGRERGEEGRREKERVEVEEGEKEIVG